jgi:CRISPR-associated endonuclease/helicase Cas3
MNDQALTAAEFPAFFQALWDKTPFPWQAALAERVLAEDPDVWPEAITLPTAAGKTACLDIALFALAAQAERQTHGIPLTAPRRIFFVVDRRVIVDEAFERARCMATRLEIAQDGVLKAVADRLRLLAGGPNEPPLACFQLRGGIYRDDSWARSPIQPTIVCSTVDQTGSRLLFRAYGRSFKAWHLQAGLVGNDSLILLDEAHCAQPFMETLNSVARYRVWAQEPLSFPFRLVVMTATLQSEPSTFPDAETKAADRAHPVLKRRIEATKPCNLVIAEKAQGKDATKVNQALADKLVAEAIPLVDASLAQAPQDDLFATQGAPAIVIFCNRVDTARRTHTLLERHHKDRAVLLTGRMRPLDKDDTISGTLALLSADRSERRRLTDPLFVVATQTLEVGANLDFDLLVSECADLAALRQRFGRLNRMGRPIQARAVIVVRADQQQEGAKPDPVYDTALTATWAWLKTQIEGNGELDMGIAGLEDRLPADLSALTVPAAQAPVMLPAHVDALAQTAPEPCPSPDVVLFLHGSQAGRPDVQVCWRADLTGDFVTDDLRDQAWIEAVGVCPPATGELMPVPITAFRRWLVGESDAADSGDLESSESGPETPDPQAPRTVLRWRGLDESGVITDPNAIRPGDLLVVPASLAGWDTLGHIPRGAAKDQGDRAHCNARAKAVLRLTAGTLAEWPESPSRQVLLALAMEAKVRLEDDPDGLAADLKAALADLASESTTPEWLGKIASHLSRERRLDRCIAVHPCGGLVVTGTKRLRATIDDGTGFSHENDATASGTLRVPLPDHLRGVREFATRFTQSLPTALAEDVQLAAFCHDLGKADPRFQALLHGGNPWVRGPLLAKSGNMPKGKADYAAALKASGYPKGGRHELLSVRLLESAPDMLAQAHDPDLVLHLIASHHGHCRPFAPVVENPSAQEVSLEIDGVTFNANNATSLERLDSGVPERFWRLIRRYGWWGLAGLEAMLMLADHRRSEHEETHAQGDTDEDE